MLTDQSFSPPVRYSIFLLLFFVFWEITSITAQSKTFFEQGYKVEHFGSEYGFPYDEVEDFLLDSQGYLWMLSSINLIRYDGIEFQFFRPEEEQRKYNFSEYFASLAEDRDGNIWIGSFADDLWKFERSSETFERIEYQSKQTANYPDSSRPYFDNEGKVWLNGLEGILRIDPASNTINTIFKSWKAERVSGLLTIIPEEQLQPVTPTDSGSQNFSLTKKSKYLVIGIGAFDYYNDRFMESGKIFNSDGQEIWQMKPYQSIALNKEYGVCLDVLDLEKGSYSIEGEQVILLYNSDMLTVDYLRKVAQSGIYLLPIADQFGDKLAAALKRWRLEGVNQLSLQNHLYARTDSKISLISELNGLFDIEEINDSFYLKKVASRIKIEGVEGIKIDSYTRKDQDNLWIWGYHTNEVRTGKRQFLGVWNFSSGQFTPLNIGGETKALFLNVPNPSKLPASNQPTIRDYVSG